MAAELNIVYPVAAATLYAIVRRKSDAYVWNGTTFVAWADGDIATYDIALTDKGGDLYQADFPSASAAVYRATFYLQAGASPAITDTILASHEYAWNGTTVTSGGTVTLSAYALTTLEKAKRYLGITTATEDDWITELINAVSARIERTCNRQLVARSQTENLGGKGSAMLVLRHVPINSITSFVSVYGAGSEETTEDIETTDYRYDSETGIVRFLQGYYSDPWSAIFGRGFMNYRIVYNGGYSTVPDDLDMVCRRVVARAYKLARLNEAATSESLGDYSVSIAASVELNDRDIQDMRPFISLALGDRK